MAMNHANSKDRLKRRADFLQAAKGFYAPKSAFIMQSCKQDFSAKPRIGFTVTKKVGNAVVRNRIRRRLKEAVRLTNADFFENHHDYVLIGKRNALAADFSLLCADIEKCLKLFANGKAKKFVPRRQRKGN